MQVSKDLNAIWVSYPTGGVLDEGELDGDDGIEDD
jgi:hypothetical protein